MFEELEPLAVLAKRGGGSGEGAAPLEYLVRWNDGSEDTWEVRWAFSFSFGLLGGFPVAVSPRLVPRNTPLLHADVLPLMQTQPERNVADDVIADFEAGLEYASARRILDRRRGAVTEYLLEVRAAALTNVPSCCGDESLCALRNAVGGRLGADLGAGEPHLGRRDARVLGPRAGQEARPKARRDDAKRGICGCRLILMSWICGS